MKLHAFSIGQNVVLQNQAHDSDATVYQITGYGLTNEIALIYFTDRRTVNAGWQDASLFVSVAA